MNRVRHHQVFIYYITTFDPSTQNPQTHIIVQTNSPIVIHWFSGTRGNFVYWRICAGRHQYWCATIDVLFSRATWTTRPVHHTDEGYNLIDGLPFASSCLVIISLCNYTVLFPSPSTLLSITMPMSSIIGIRWHVQCPWYGTWRKLPLDSSVLSELVIGKIWTRSVIKLINNLGSHTQ